VNAQYCDLCTGPLNEFRVGQLCPDCSNILDHQPRGTKKLIQHLINRIAGLQGQIDHLKGRKRDC